METTFKLSQSIVGTLLIPFLLCLALLLVSGCGGGVSAIVGKWSIEPGQPTWGIPEDLELLKDKTGIVDEMGVTWKVEGGRFYLTHPLHTQAWDYKISGSTLTLTDNDGQKITYKKKK